jgi:hypothetical protein
MDQHRMYRALRPSETLATATVATIIALGLLWSVVALFQSRGAPFEELAAAERACAQHVYVSDREACMAQWVNGQRRTQFAGRPASASQ